RRVNEVATALKDAPVIAFFFRTGVGVGPPEILGWRQQRQNRGGTPMRPLVRFIIASLLAALPQAASARDVEGWVVSWTGSAQGPYPVGNPSAQPDQKFAFPDPATGARD